MSIGQPCRHCSRGKMRPIHFSWDQAVVLCDNTKCKSVLDVSPSECIITKHVFHPKHEEVPSESGLQCLLKGGSNSSSSGVYSEARSSLPSPAQSKKSATDEEVEYLLRSCYAPKRQTKTTATHPVPSAAATHTQTSSKPQNPQLDSSKYDGFFELLGSLDLEPQSQVVQPEPQVAANPMETSFDIVTAELEGWMQDFDFNFDNPSNEPAVLDQRPPEAVRSSSMADMQGAPFLSQGSAFTPIDTPKEYSSFFNAQNSSASSLVCQNSLVNNETPNYLQQFENTCISTPFESEFVSGSVKNFDARFMSPTTSAASEDSGYNEAMVGAEPLVSEANSKGSSKTTFFSSSLKSQNGNSFGNLTTPTSEDNLKDLIQNNLEWPVMSGMNTLTVLPAMVSTEESIANPSQEPQSSPPATQATASDEPNTTGQEMKKQAEMSADEPADTPQVNSVLHQDNEPHSTFLGHHDIVSATEEAVSVDNENISDSTTVVHDLSDKLDSLAVETVSTDHENIDNHGKAPADSTPTAVHDGTEQIEEMSLVIPEVHVASPSESCQTSVTSPESSVSRETSPSTSEVKECGDVHMDLITEDTVSPEHHKVQCDSPSDSTHTPVTSSTPESSVEPASHCAFSEAKATSDNVDAGNVCLAAPASPKRRRKRRKWQGTNRILRARKSELSEGKPGPANDDNTSLDSKTPRARGRSKNRRLEEIKKTGRRKGGRPRLKAKADGDSLNMAYLGKVTEWPGSAGTVHLKEKLRTTSSWDNYVLEHAEEELGGDGSLELPGGHTPEGGTYHLGPRGRTLSPRKIHVGHVNKDPWSVMELYLEELTVEIVVSGRSKTKGSLSKKAAKGSEQLQQVLASCSKGSELGVSESPSTDTVQGIPSESTDRTVTEKQSGECLSRGEHSGLSDSEGKTLVEDGKQNTTGQDGQDLQAVETQSSTKSLPKETESCVSATDLVNDAPSVVSKGTVLDSDNDESPTEREHSSVDKCEEETPHGDGDLNKAGNCSETKDSESVVSCVPSAACDGVLLDEKDRESSSRRENSGIIDSTETVIGDGNQNSLENSGQNVEYQVSTKTVDLKEVGETKLKGSSSDTFHSSSVASVLPVSQLQVISESKHTGHGNAHLDQSAENDIALKLDKDSDKNKELTSAAKIDSNSLFSEKLNTTTEEEIGCIASFSEETRLVKQLNSISIKEGVAAASSEGENSCCGGAEVVNNVKLCLGKQSVEAGNLSTMPENCELDKESLVIQKTKSPTVSVKDVDIIEKTCESPESVKLKTEEFVSKETIQPSVGLDIVGVTEKTVGAVGKTALETMHYNTMSDTVVQSPRTGERKSLWNDRNCGKYVFVLKPTVKAIIDLEPATDSLKNSCNVGADSNSSSPAMSRAASPTHFLNPPKHDDIRSWIGDKDSVLEEVTEASDSSKPSPDKSRLASSTYFQSLIEDVEFDSCFFRSSVRENPKETFDEHLRSSLFFGETASNDFLPSHAEFPDEEFPEFKISPTPNCISVFIPQACSSGSSPLAYKVPVPLPCSIAQPPNASTPNNPPHTTLMQEKGANFVMVPENSQVTGGVVTLPSSPFSLLPQHLNIGSGGKGVGCKELGAVSISESAKPRSKETADVGSLGAAVKPGCQGFTGLPSEVCSDHMPEISECTVVLAQSPPLGSQVKESKLDDTLKTECESKLSTKFTDALGKNVTSNQTSLCHCSGAGGDSEACDCDSEYKKDTPVYSKERTNHDGGNGSFSDDEDDNLPTLSLDSDEDDDEVSLTVEEKALDGRSSSQAGNESVTSDESSLNGQVIHCYQSDENLEAELQEIFGSKRTSVKELYQCGSDETVDMKLGEVESHDNSHRLIGTGFKRKADDQGDSYKKQKLCNALSDDPVENCEQAQDQFVVTPMCGILDDSVPHDEGCHSSTHEHFQDFATSEISIERHHKSYTRSKKRCTPSISCKDDINTPRSSLAKNSTGDFSITSSSQEIVNLRVKTMPLFTRCTDFGCLKADPEYGGRSASGKSNPNDLNFFQLSSSHSGFLSPLISPTESPVPSPKPEEEIGAMDKLVQGSDSKQCTPLESGVSHRSNSENMSSLKVEKQSGITHDSRRNENTGMGREKHKPLQQVIKSNTAVSLIGNDGMDIKDKSAGPQNVKADHKQPFVREINQSTSGFVIGKDGVIKTINTAPQTISQLSKTYDSLANIYEPPAQRNELNRPSETVSSVDEDNLPVTALTQNNNTFYYTSTDPSDPRKVKRMIVFRKSSHPSSISIVPNQPSASASTVSTNSAPHQPRTMFPAVMGSQNALPLLTATHPASRQITILNFAHSDAKKQENQLHQESTSLNTYSVVPPTPTVTDASVSQSSGLKNDLLLPHLRLSGAGVLSQAALSHVDNNSKLPSQNENKNTQEEDGSMLKKVKLGSKGFFYLRPTTALKNAIKEMRDRAEENKKEEENSSGFMTLPDGGTPICHPIFIRKRKEAPRKEEPGERVVRPRKKLQRKKRRLRAKRLRNLVVEKVKESLETCNEEVPKMIVICSGKSFHICQIDVTEDR